MDRFVNGMRGNAKQSDERAHSLGRQTISRKVNPIDTGGEGNIRAIVHKDTACCAHRQIANFAD